VADINGNPVIRDVSGLKIPGLSGALEGSLVYGPGQRPVEVTEERFPDLDKAYVQERDQLTEQKRRAANARANRGGI
jgi:hypothetical protein